MQQLELESESSEFSVSHRLRKRVESKAAWGYRLRVKADLEIMDAVVEVERTHFYREDGFQSTAEWLCNFLGMGYTRSCEFVEVALCLSELPQLRNAFREGRLSYDHLRALVQVAGEDSEADLLKEVEGMSVGDTFRLVRKIRKVSAEDSIDSRKDRWVEMTWDFENRNLLLYAQLPEDLGARVEKAINAIAKDLPDDPLLGPRPTPMGVKRADALVRMAGRSQLADFPKAMVVVHAEVEALTGADGVAEIEGGPVISSDTASKMACDSVIQVVVHGKDGMPMNAGRSRRTVTARQKRQLLIRDRHCRYPGCHRLLGLDAHHMKEWAADEGRTDLEELVLFCDLHHDFVHRNMFKVRGDPPNIWIERPNGPPIKPGPPRLTDEDSSEGFDQT